jgi:hypothetical protein
MKESKARKAAVSPAQLPCSGWSVPMSAGPPRNRLRKAHRGGGRAGTPVDHSTDDRQCCWAGTTQTIALDVDGPDFVNGPAQEVFDTSAWS